MDIWRPEADSIHKRSEAKMITSQECLQMKRDLEAKLSDFELNPLALSLMITLLLIGIGFWMWLISWSCIFEQPKEEDCEERDRLTGGKSKSSKNMEGGFSRDSSEMSVPSQLLRGCPPIACQDMPDLEHISNISLPPAESNTQEATASSSGPTSAATNRKQTLLRCEAGTPTSYGSTASSLGLDNFQPRKKYNIQWTKLLGREGRDGFDN